MEIDVIRELRVAILSIATIGTLLFSTLTAFAANPSVGNDTTLQTVVVTAQRRRENPQHVPISMQVVTGAELTKQNFNSLDSLSETVPGVYVHSDGRGSDMFIRGIGSGLNQSFDQAVSTFVDGIYEGRSRMSDSTFLDLSRIEVLKGPQSTFFGNNAIAGAIRLVTAKPGKRFGGSVRALYGQYGQYAIEGAAGGPISDAFGVRIALIRDGDRGFLYNTNLHRHEPTNNNEAGRVTFTYRSDQDFNATLMVQAGRQRDEGDQGTFEQVAGCPPTAPFTPAGFCKLIIAQGLPSGTNNNFTAFPARGYSLNSHLLVLTVNYRRWGDKFTTVTGYTGYHFHINEAGNETQNNGSALFTVNAPEHYHQFSQEFRVTSAPNRTLEYLAGAYFQTDQLYYAQNFDFALFSPLLASAPPFAPLTLPMGEATNVTQNEHSYALFGSATWNITKRLKLTGGLRGTWVLRNFHNATLYGQSLTPYAAINPYSGTLCTAPDASTNPPTGLQALASVLGLGEPCTFRGRRSDHSWLPSAQLQYRITPSAMAYFSYAKGFLAGGFNGADTTGIASNVPYSPEYVNAYELGMKSEWFHHSLLLNFDVFRSNYRGLQVSSFIVNPAPVAIVNNAASAISQGLEFEGEWAAGAHFQLSADVTYLHSYYANYPNATLTTLQTYCGSPKDVPNPSANTGCVVAFGPSGKLPTPYQDLSGKPTAFAPKWSGSVVATYSTSLPHGLRFIATVSPFLTTGYFLSGNGTDDPLEHQGGYLRLDGRLTLESSDTHWALDVIGKNLTNKVILTQIAGLPASIGSFQASKEMPRNISVQIRYRW